MKGIVAWKAVKGRTHREHGGKPLSQPVTKLAFRNRNQKWINRGRTASLELAGAKRHMLKRARPQAPGPEEALSQPPVVVASQNSRLTARMSATAVSCYPRPSSLVAGA